MLCYYWNKVSFFCKIKDRIINPEESSVCEECTDYKPFKASKHVSCNNCGNNFEFKDRIVLVNNKASIECPNCGEFMGINRNDVGPS
jgi:hypothetical protein